MANQCTVCGIDERLGVVLVVGNETTFYCYEHRWKGLNGIRTIMQHNVFVQTRLTVEWHNAKTGEFFEDEEAVDESKSDELEDAYALARSLGYDFGSPGLTPLESSDKREP